MYRNLLDKLKIHHAVDEVIEEPLSPDWRAEQELLPGLLRDLEKKDQWIPRVGDIVLYLRGLPEGVDAVQSTEYDEQATSLRPPYWEAGLVGEVPVTATTLKDLVEDDQYTNVVNFGVRIEPIPDPNSTNKSLSKRHKYVSLRLTRPLVLWKELLYQIPQEDWHPTIRNALSVASTLSLVGKHRFRGTWPNANIYCHGLYLGFEMLAVGDTVRLLPSTKLGQTSCSDILTIKSIRLKWSNMHIASDNDYDEGRPYNSEIWIYGSAYTSDFTRTDKQWMSDQNQESPKAAHNYASWYPLHPPSKDLAVPYTRVLSRLYERDAVALWLNTEPDDLAGLDVGREGLMEARAFSRDHDQRIAQELNATWYWGDSRADALNLHTINGLEVSKYDQERDIRQRRKDIKLIEGMTKSNSSTGLKSTTTRTNASQWRQGLASFMAPDISSLQGSRTTASAANTLSNSKSSASENKRAFTDDFGGKNEEEIRKYTKIIEEEPVTRKKKASVLVVID